MSDDDFNAKFNKLLEQMKRPKGWQQAGSKKTQKVSTETGTSSSPTGEDAARKGKQVLQTEPAPQSNAPQSKVSTETAPASTEEEKIGCNINHQPTHKDLFSDVNMSQEDKWNK